MREIGAGQNGAAQVGAIQLRSQELRATQIGKAEVGARKIRIGKIRLDGLGIHDAFARINPIGLVFHVRCGSFVRVSFCFRQIGSAPVADQARAGKIGTSVRSAPASCAENKTASRSEAPDKFARSRKLTVRLHRSSVARESFAPFNTDADSWHPENPRP